MDFLLKISKPLEKPSKNISQIKEEVQALSAENVQPIEDSIPKIVFSASSREKSPVLSQIIVENKNSSVSAVIDKLQNSDWVKQGFDYLPNELKKEAEICPFCQRATITPELLSDLRKYFDEAYENDLKEIKNIGIEYHQVIDSLPIITAFEKYDFLKELKKGFNIAYEKLRNTFEHNIQLPRDKYKSPSIQITLEDSMELLNATNKIIDDANKLIGEFNTKITQKGKVLQALKEDFWNIQRLEYDQTIDSYKENKIKSETELQRIRKEVSDIDKLTYSQK